MKKLLMVTLLLVATVFTTNVFAMSEDALYKHATQTVTANGKTYTPTTQAKNELKRFLKNNDVSEADCDTLAAKYDKAIELMKNSGKKTYKAYIKANLSEAVDLANETANAVDSIKSITVDADGVITITDKNDKTYAIADPASKTSGTIKNTGSVVLYSTMGVTALGVLLIGIKARKENN